MKRRIMKRVVVFNGNKFWTQTKYEDGMPHDLCKEYCAMYRFCGERKGNAMMTRLCDALCGKDGCFIEAEKG